MGALTGEDAQRASAPPGQRRWPDDLVRLARIRECRARVAGPRVPGHQPGHTGACEHADDLRLQL